MKTSYKLICHDDVRGSASGSNLDEKKFFWSSLWKPKVLRKLKHFIWKACTNSLLKRSNFQEKNCLILYVSGREVKDAMHTLWGCEVMRVVWCNDFKWVNKFDVSRAGADLGFQVRGGRSIRRKKIQIGICGE